MHSLKSGKDYFVNLNSPDIRTAIIYIIEEKVGIKFTLSDIKFDNKRNTLIIKGKDFFCYYRNLKCSRCRDHVYATFLFLKSLEEIVVYQNTWIRSLI